MIKQNYHGNLGDIIILTNYNIELGNRGGINLDIGAVPGGCTKVLVNHGFDIVVNDVNVDPAIRAEIMNFLAHILKDGGMAIVTFLEGQIEKG